MAEAQPTCRTAWRLTSASGGRRCRWGNDNWWPWPTCCRAPPVQAGSAPGHRRVGRRPGEHWKRDRFRHPYLRESLLTREEQRREREKPLIEAGKDTPFPGWDAVREEQKEIDPAIVLTIRDAEGRVVRRLEDGPTAQGFHRIAWDLRYPATQAIGVEGNWFAPEVQGIMAPPGQYTAELARRVDGEITQLATTATNFPQLITENPPAMIPKPIMAPTMEWVVETGRDFQVANDTHRAAASRADRAPMRARCG